MSFYRRFDQALPCPPLPSLDALVDALVRRRASAAERSPEAEARIRETLGALGLADAHERLRASDDPDRSWWCPRGEGDTFGARPGDTYFRSAGLAPLPLLSFALVWAKSERVSAAPGARGPLLDRASRLVVATMALRGRLASEAWEQDREGGRPLNMIWYDRIFGSAVRVHPGACELHQAPLARSEHVAVMVRGQVYFFVPGEGARTVRAQLEAVLAAADAREPGLAVGVLTAAPLDEQLRFRQELEAESDRNRDASARLRDAAFVLCLEPDEAPASVGAAIHAVHAGGFANRSYDKSLCLVVFANGEAGLVGNYFSGLTGTVATALSARLHRDAEAVDGDGGDEAPGEIPEAVTWDDPSGALAATVRAVTERFAGHAFPASPFKRGPRDDVHVVSRTIGRRALKAAGVSPGAAFQVALQLAAHGAYRGPSSVWEAAHLRRFRYGGMLFFEAVMGEMRAFVRRAGPLFDAGGGAPPAAEAEELRGLLRRALAEYRADADAQKAGSPWMWHLDALYREVGIPTRLRETPPDTEEARARRGGWFAAMGAELLPGMPDFATSNPWMYPEIDALGRCGVFALVPPTCMALHYLMDADRTIVVPNTNPQHPFYEREGELTAGIARGLDWVLGLC